MTTEENMLIVAARNGMVDDVKIAIPVVDVDVQDSANGWTALHYAVSQGNLTIATVLLAAGAKIDVKDCGGMTPLHIAVLENVAASVSFLIERGADIDARDDYGYTPRQLANNYGVGAKFAPLFAR